MYRPSLFGLSRHFPISSFGEMLISGTWDAHRFLADPTFKHYYEKATKNNSQVLSDTLNFWRLLFGINK